MKRLEEELPASSGWKCAESAHSNSLSAKATDDPADYPVVRGRRLIRAKDSGTIHMKTCTSYLYVHTQSHNTVASTTATLLPWLWPCGTSQEPRLRRTAFLVLGLLRVFCGLGADPEIPMQLIWLCLVTVQFVGLNFEPSPFLVISVHYWVYWFQNDPKLVGMLPAQPVTVVNQSNHQPFLFGPAKKINKGSFVGILLSSFQVAWKSIVQY